MNGQILFVTLAVLAGAMIPFQSAINAFLGKHLQSPYYAALTVFAVAIIAIALYIIVARHPPPAIQLYTKSSLWSYAGGIFGGTYILLIIVCAPKLGIGNVTIMVLLGQVIAATVIDHFGLLHSVKHLLNWQRTLGLLLVIAGVYITKKY